MYSHIFCNGEKPEHVGYYPADQRYNSEYAAYYLSQSMANLQAVMYSKPIRVPDVTDPLWITFFYWDGEHWCYDHHGVKCAGQDKIWFGLLERVR